MNLFDDFDFSILENQSFKEDSVREEIIAPIIRKVGYRPSGDIRVERGKALSHPFVIIGSKKREVKIIPDYTLFFKEKALMILDAKAPGKEIYKSKHVEQAYSYAIHPDIRCEYYSLCNGQELIIYSIHEWEPIFRIDLSSVDEKWEELKKHLHPKFLLMPDLRDFMDDYGLHAKKAGITKDIELVFIGYYLQEIIKVSEEVFTATSHHKEDDRDFCVSFDYSSDILKDIIIGIPEEYAAELKEGLQNQPFQFRVDAKISISCRGRLGDMTTGAFEKFVPVLVDEIIDVSFKPHEKLQKRKN